MAQNILKPIGGFSDRDLDLFEKYSTKQTLRKNELVLKIGNVCRSLYYVLSGSFYQYQPGDIDDSIIDLHIETEWMYNHSSFINQTPSQTSIKAFVESEVIELSLINLHQLIAESNTFLQFGKIFGQGSTRTYFFDNSLKPDQKYNYIKAHKPALPATFPVKMIASYLKMAPETLSRLRARY